MDFAKVIAEEFKIAELYAQNTVKLLEEENTVPFIARYRKEMTGALDDQTIRRMALRLQALRNLEARKEEIRSAIEGKGALTPELEKALAAADMLRSCYEFSSEKGEDSPFIKDIVR